MYQTFSFPIHQLQTYCRGLEECTGEEEDDGSIGRGYGLKKKCFTSVFGPIVVYGVWIEVAVLDWIFSENEDESKFLDMGFFYNRPNQLL